MTTPRAEVVVVKVYALLLSLLDDFSYFHLHNDFSYICFLIIGHLFFFSK